MPIPFRNLLTNDIEWLEGVNDGSESSPYAGKSVIQGGTVVGPNNPLHTRGQSKTLTQTLTTSSTEYLALDNIGGKLALANAFRDTDRGIYIQTVRVVVAANSAPAIKLLFCNADPNNGSAVYTDNAAVNYRFEDHAKAIAVVRLSDVEQIDSNTWIAQWAASAPGLGLFIRPGGTTSLWAVPQAYAPMTLLGTADAHLLINAIDE